MTSQTEDTDNTADHGSRIPPNGDQPDQPDQAEPEELAFTPEELVDWVEYLAAMLESVDRSQGMYWCSQWWKHPEAVDRLRGLYERWLEAQAEGGMSSWWVDHFDRHAPVLFAKRGPFGECGTSHAAKTTRRILAAEHPPCGWQW